MPLIQMPSTGWGHDCDSSVEESLDTPKGFRLWRVSDGASEVTGQKFCKIIYSVQHNASKENLQDPLWLPPPGFYLDLWGIYLAAKLSPSKRKRFNLWPQLFTTQGDILRDFPRFGTAPQVSFWQFHNESWVSDMRKGGNGMYIVWRDATVLASREVQRELDKLNIYRTRTAVVDGAKMRNCSEFTFGQFSASKVEPTDFDRDDRIVVATARLQDRQYDQWQFIATSAVGKHHWTKVVLNKDYDRRHPYLTYDTYVGNNSDELLELWAPNQVIGCRQPRPAKEFQAMIAQHSNGSSVKRQKRRALPENYNTMNRPSKRHRNDNGSKVSNRSVSHSSKSSRIVEDDDDWAVRETDAEDTYDMQQDDNWNDWTLDEIDQDQREPLSGDVSNDWIVQEDDEDDEERLPQNYEEADWALVEDQASAISSIYSSDSETSEIEDDGQYQRRSIEATKTTRQRPRSATRRRSPRPHTRPVRVPQPVDGSSLTGTGSAAAEPMPPPPPGSMGSQAFGLSVDITLGNEQHRREAMPSQIDMLRAQVSQHRSNAAFHRLRMHHSLMAVEELQKVLDQALASSSADYVSPTSAISVKRENSRPAGALVDGMLQPPAW